MRLAWPVAVAQLGLMLLGVVDVAMVGRLGEGALAGVMLGHTWAFSVQALLLGAAIGIEPIFAQSFGARRPDRAGDALVRGAALLAVLSAPIIALHLVAGWALPLLGQPADAAQVAGEYAAVRALGVPAFAGLALLRSAMQARGQMLPGAVAIGVGNAANVVLNGWLVLGWFGLPAMGAVGAAWASVGATMVMLAVILALSSDLWREIAPRWSAAFEARPLRVLLGVAMPVSLQVALESWGFSISTVLMGWMGTTALSAHAVALTLASLAFMLPLGMSSAVSARVGNLIGAGRPWGRPAVVAIALGAAVMVASGAMFAAVPRALALVFTTEEPVLALAIALLPVAGAFALFDGIQVVTFGVLRGAGDTGVPAAANVVGYYLVGLPLGALMAFGLGFGPRGVWFGLLVALAMVSILLLFRLRSTWRRGGFRVG